MEDVPGDVSCSIGTVTSLTASALPGVWLFRLVLDVDDTVLETVLHHEHHASTPDERKVDQLLWLHTGRLAAFDSDAAQSPELLRCYDTNRVNDYPMFEHDRVFSHGVVVTLAPDAVVGVPVFVTERDGRVVGVRIHNPWNTLLEQRRHNRMREYFEMFSCDARNMLVDDLDVIVFDWELYRPSSELRKQYPEPLFNAAERDVIYAYDRAWTDLVRMNAERATNLAFAELTSQPRDQLTSSLEWNRLCAMGAIAFKTFAARPPLPEEVELDAPEG